MSLPPVAWDKLQHALGPATDVPRLVQDLAKPGHPSDAASYHLWESLVVHGRWLETSLPAAELILGLLTENHAKPIPRALRVLADLASAGHLWFITPQATATRQADSFGVATLAVAQRAIPLATNWLSSTDGEVRAAAIFFLSLVEADAADLIAAIMHNDELAEVRAGAALALGLYARAGHQASEQALSAPTSDPFVHAGVWAGRAIAGLLCREEETTRAIASWFVRWKPPLLPWGYTRPLEVVNAVVRLLPNCESLAPALVRSTAENQSAIICKVALGLAGFTTSFQESDVVPASRLSPLQRATAEALMEQSSSMVGLGYGLPGSTQAAARWLGLAPPGPLERVEDGGLMRWQHVRTLFAAAEPPTAAQVISASLDGLSPRDQLEVATELLLGAYAILMQAEATFSPKELEDLARGARDDGVAWAKQTASLVADIRARGGTAFQLSPRHVMMILGLLVEASTPIEPEWEPLILIDTSPICRAVLSSLPQSRRDHFVLKRLADLEPDDDSKADFLDQLTPLLDVLGSPTVLQALRGN